MDKTKKATRYENLKKEKKNREKKAEQKAKSYQKIIGKYDKQGGTRSVG